MEIFYYIKKLYTCDRAFEKHLILFSIVGLMMIMANNICSILFNNILINHITTMPANDVEVYIDFFFGLIFWFYLMGYEYLFINNYLNKKEICLPDFTDKPASVFFKMFWVFVVWQVYFAIFSYICFSVLINMKSTLYSYLLATIMLAITPFVFMIYVNYAKDFKFKKHTINPLIIIKYIDTTLIDVVIWGIKFGLFSLIPISIITCLMKFATTAQTNVGEISIYLLSLCIGGYLFVITKLIYSIGISNIVAKNFKELK